MLNLPLKNISSHLDSLRQNRSSLLNNLSSSKASLNHVTLDSGDYELIRSQSFELGSSERYLDVTLLEWLCKHTEDSQSLDKVLLGCFNAGRFEDLIKLYDSLSPTSEISSQLNFASSYRLADWQKVNKISHQWESYEPPFDFICMAIKACLELKSFDRLPSLFSALQPSTSHQEHQLEVLDLLRAFMQGFASEYDAYKLLALLPTLSSDEISWFVRFYPQVLVLTRSSSSIQRLIRASWNRLAQPAILETSRVSSPLLPESKVVKRIALVLENDSDENVAKASLLKKSFQNYPGYEIVAIYLVVCNDTFQSDTSQISLLQTTVKSRVDILRSYDFDIVVDSVGPQDPSWLLTVSQGVAPLQLAWFESHFPIPANSPYKGQIVDRWTLPDPVSAYDSLCLKISGTRQFVQLPKPDLSPTFSDKDPVSLIVLGSPSSMLRGVASMFKNCLEESDIDQLLFVNPSWASPGFLSAWWSHYLSEKIPSNCNLLNCHQLPSGSRYIAIDLNVISPCNEAASFLSNGIPVVSLKTPSLSSCGTSSILSSLGLESLSTSSVDIWLQTVQVLASDISSYTTISSHLKSTFKSSLLCDYPLFTRDLVSIISLLDEQ